MQLVREREQLGTKCRLENRKGGYHSEDPDLNMRIILKWFLGEEIARLWNEFIWLGDKYQRRYLVNDIINLQAL